MRRAGLRLKETRRNNLDRRSSNRYTERARGEKIRFIIEKAADSEENRLRQA